MQPTRVTQPKPWPLQHRANAALIRVKQVRVRVKRDRVKRNLAVRSRSKANRRRRFN